MIIKLCKYCGGVFWTNRNAKTTCSSYRCRRIQQIMGQRKGREPRRDMKDSIEIDVTTYFINCSMRFGEHKIELDISMN